MTRIDKREYRNMAGHHVTVTDIGEDEIRFQYPNGRVSSLPRSTVEHAIRTARWS